MEDPKYAARFVEKTSLWQRISAWLTQNPLGPRGVLGLSSLVLVGIGLAVSVRSIRNQ